MAKNNLKKIDAVAANAAWQELEELRLEVAGKLKLRNFVIDIDAFNEAPFNADGSINERYLKNAVKLGMLVGSLGEDLKDLVMDPYKTGMLDKVDLSVWDSDLKVTFKLRLGQRLKQAKDKLKEWLKSIPLMRDHWLTAEGQATYDEFSAKEREDGKQKTATCSVE